MPTTDNIHPTIMNVIRTSRVTATLHFTVSQNEQNADYFEITYFNHTEDVFNPVSTLKGYIALTTILNYTIELYKM